VVPVLVPAAVVPVAAVPLCTRVVVPVAEVVAVPIGTQFGLVVLGTAGAIVGCGVAGAIAPEGAVWVPVVEVAPVVPEVAPVVPVEVVWANAVPASKTIIANVRCMQSVSL
jgi:hypothetical protein